MLNPSLLKAVTRKAVRYEFEDPNQSQPWVMWLKPPDDLELGYGADIQTEMEARYMTGGWVDSRGIYQEKPEAMYDAKGNPIVVSKEVLQYASRLEAMQDAPPSENFEYTAAQIMGLIPFYPVAWQQIKRTFWELLKVPKEPTSDTPAS